MLVGVAITFGILVAVFSIILPQFIDYEAMVEAFFELELWQLGILAVMAAATYVLQGLILRIPCPASRSSSPVLACSPQRRARDAGLAVRAGPSLCDVAEA